MRRRSVGALARLLLIAAAPAFAAAEVRHADLDRLLAQRLSADSPYVRMVPTQELELSATVQSLPQPGKTAYLVDTLATRGLKPVHGVGHKMLLRSSAGASVMAYVDDATAIRMQKSLKAGDEISVFAAYLWDSRHGPGLLVHDYERKDFETSRLRRFGGKAPETRQ